MNESHTLTQTFPPMPITLHSHSQVICRGSSDDGVERPLGETLARCVVDEGYHDDGAIHPGRGQFHQLAGKQIKVRGVSVCV